MPIKKVNNKTENNKKIDKRVNNRKLSELSAKEVPHILKVFDL